MLKPTFSRYLMAVVSLIGLFTSVYLLYEYITGGDIACALVSGCDIVRATRWAWPFGIPLPLFGLLFYISLFGWLVIRAIMTYHIPWFVMLGRIAIALGLIESIFLTFVEWLDIQSFCFWCLVSAACAALLFIFSFFDRHLEHTPEEKNKELKVYLGLLILFLLLGGLLFAWLTGLLP